MIVDFNHMAHNFSYSGLRLTRTLKVGGQVQTIDTTIASGAIKNIFNWSKGGRIPTIVCFDRPCPSRKAYFIKEQSKGVDGEYKGKRESMSNDMYKGIEIAQDLLERGGVNCLALHNWEADDLVYLAILKAKEQYPNHYIDVITNDADMLPLVDEQVSVFFRSKKFTWAESKDLEKNRYIQVTPANYSEVVEGLSAFKNLNIPYNSLLLYKILKGDTADGLVSPFKKRTMTPRRLSSMIWQMENGLLRDEFELTFEKGTNQPLEIRIKKGADLSIKEKLKDILDIAFVRDEHGNKVTVDISDLFTYTPSIKEYRKVSDGSIISKEEALALVQEYKDGGSNGIKPVELVYLPNPKVEEMVKTLITFGLTEDEAESFRRQYIGMNLAQPFYDLPKEIRRGSITLGDFSGFNGRELNTVVSVLGINLNSRYL